MAEVPEQELKKALAPTALVQVLAIVVQAPMVAQVLAIVGAVGLADSAALRAQQASKNAIMAAG